MPSRRRLLVLIDQIALICLASLMFFVYVTVYPANLARANFFAIAGFVFLGLAVLLQTVAHAKVSPRQTDFYKKKLDSVTDNKQNEPTLQAERLHEALDKRGVHNELEFDDGYKHTDICIPSAKLNLEIDGKYHITDPEHLFRDLKRDSYSHMDGIDTIRIPNFYVDNHLDEVANAITEVVRKRRESRQP